MARVHDKAEITSSAGDPLDLGKLSAWAPELARTFVALASDIALVIDDSGVIRTVEQGEATPIAPGAHEWVGRSWVDTVSGDTRGKIEKLLNEAAGQGIARRREVNHPMQPGVSLPIAYTAIRLGENGPVLAVGRDMRAIAAIQERFIESQQDLERGYWNARQAESRHRLLAQVATDAVLAIDPESLAIVEANPAATTLFAHAGDQLVGRHAAIGFAHTSRNAVNELLATARTSGRSGEIRARLVGTVLGATVAATSFRAGDGMRLLMRVRALDASVGTPVDDLVVTRTDQLAAQPWPERLADVGGDAAVVTDSSGRVLLASAGFLGLARLAGEGDAQGRPLIDWLGGPTTSLPDLIVEVRRRGVVRSAQATVKAAGVEAVAVEISATLLTEGDQECIGFTIRRPLSGAIGAAPNPPALRDELERLVGRLGQLPLAALVAEAAAVAERHFIHLALERTDGDADAAANLLGVGRERLAADVRSPRRRSDHPDPSSA